MIKNIRKIAIILIFSIILNMFPTILSNNNSFIDKVYAARDGEIEEEDLDEEDIDEEDKEESEDTNREFTEEAYIQQIEEFEFKDEIFDQLLDIFLDTEADGTFSEYTSPSSGLANKIPHAPTFKSEKKGVPTGEVIKFDNYFHDIKRLGLKLKFIGEMHSIYMDPLTWRQDMGIATPEYWPTGFRNILAFGLKDTIDEDTSVQVDSYGNLITNKRQVIAPFFTSDEITTKIVKANKNGLFDDYAKLRGAKKVTFISHLPSKEILNSLTKNFDKASVLDFKLYGFYINKSGEVVDLSEISKNTDGSVQMSELVGWLNGSASDIFGSNRTATRKFIEDNYKDYVMDFNYHFMDTAVAVFKSDEPKTIYNRSYLGATNMDLIELDATPELDNGKLLENLLLSILQGGFGKLLQLTIAYAVAEIYEELFIEFSSKYIFHTESYTETNSFNDLYGAYVVVVIMTIILFVIISAIKILTGRTTITKVVQKIGLIVILTTLPVILYNEAVQFSFNVAPAKITRNEIKQLLVLDRWAKISEEDYEKIDTTKLIFSLDKEFRGTNYNYLIKFNTTRFGDQSNKEYLESYIKRESGYDEDGNMIDSDLYAQQELSKINNKRVMLQVDANHLIDYFKNTTPSNLGRPSEDLFMYLVNNNPDSYLGLASAIPYEEYKYFIDDRKDVLGMDKFEEGYLTASELGVRLFDYYKNKEVDIAGRMKLLTEYLALPGITNERKEQVITKLSGIQSIENRDYYSSLTEDDFNSDLEYQAFLKEKELMEYSTYGDITEIYEFLKTISIVEGDITSGVEGALQEKKLEQIRKIVREINQSVISEYLDTINSINTSMRMHDGDEKLNEAISDVTKLNIYFELNKIIDTELFPTDIETSRVESDVYIRSLVIPLQEMDPENSAVANAALYVGATKSIFTLGTFISMIILMAGYGLIKLLVISRLLLPVLLVLIIWNYIVQENFDNKVWFGASYILAVFVIVHWLLIGLWSYCSTKMNLALADMLGGRSSFFNTGTNSLIICVYFILVMKYMIYPTLKTAIKNPGDLGGGVQFEKTKAMASKLTGAASGLFKGLLDDDKAPKSKRTKNDKTTGDTAEEETRKRKQTLKQDKKTADKEKAQAQEEAGDDGSFGEDIMDNVNKRKAERNTSEFAGEGAGSTAGSARGKKAGKINIVSDRGEYESIDQPEIKEKIERLKNRGIFEAKTESFYVEGEASNKMEFDNEIAANSVGKVLTENGIENAVEDSTVHFEETDQSAINLQPDIQKSLNSTIKELDTTEVASGETVAGAHYINKMGFDQNPEISEQLGVLKDKGIIQNYYDTETPDGNVRTVVHGTSEGIKEVKSVIESYGSEDIQNSIDESQVVRFNDNQATYEAMEAMGITEYSEVSSNGSNYIEIPTTASKSSGLINEIEELSNDLADVKGIEEPRQQFVRVNANNDIIKHYISDTDNINSAYMYNKSVEGVDYFLNGNEYVSVTDRGYHALNYVSEIASEQGPMIKEEIANMGEILVESSDYYADTTKNTGVQHITTNLAYDTGVVMKEIENIRNYKGTDTDMLDLRRTVNMTHDIKADHNEIKVYTSDKVTKNEIQDLINRVQHQVYTKEKRPSGGKETDTSSTLDAINLLRNTKNNEE